MLINNSPLEEVIESALYASYVKPNGLPILPVGLMLVSKSGLGKSKTLFQYAYEPYVHRSDSLTGSGIIDLMARDHKNEMSFIMHGDFNEALSHKTSVVALMSATLLSAMSDGVVSMDDGRQQKSVQHNPIGIITGMTADMYYRHEKKWHALGLSRRFLFIFYKHSYATEEEIQTQIRNGGQSNAPVPLKSLKVPLPLDKKIPIKIPIGCAEKIEKYSDELANIRSHYPQFGRKNGKMMTFSREKEAPYSTHHMLRALACGHALRDNRRVEVSKVDVDFVRDVLSFCDWRTPKEL